MNWDLNWSSIVFISCKFINMNGEFFSKNLDNFSLVSLTSSPENDNLVILSDGEGSNSVLFAEILGQSG